MSTPPTPTTTTAAAAAAAATSTTTAAVAAAPQVVTQSQPKAQQQVRAGSVRPLPSIQQYTKQKSHQQQLFQLQTRGMSVGSMWKLLEKSMEKSAALEAEVAELREAVRAARASANAAAAAGGASNPYGAPPTTPPPTPTFSRAIGPTCGAARRQALLMVDVTTQTEVVPVSAKHVQTDEVAVADKSVSTDLEIAAVDAVTDGGTTAAAISPSPPPAASPQPSALACTDESSTASGTRLNVTLEDDLVNQLSSSALPETPVLEELRRSDTVTRSASSPPPVSAAAANPSSAQSRLGGEPAVTKWRPYKLNSFGNLPKRDPSKIKVVIHPPSGVNVPPFVKEFAATTVLGELINTFWAECGAALPGTNRFPIFKQLLQENSFALSRAICESAFYVEANYILKTMLQVHDVMGKLPDFLESVAKFEVECNDSTETLFRKSGLVSMLFFALLQEKARYYLADWITPVFNKWQSHGDIFSYEMDPQRVSHGDSISANREHLRQAVADFIEAVGNSVKFFPTVVKNAFSQLWAKVLTRFGPENGKKAMLSFMVMRILVPVVTTEAENDAKSIAPNLRRGLVLLPRLMQNIVDGSLFEQDMDFMAPLNPIILHYGKALTTNCENLVLSQLDEVESACTISSHTDETNLLQLHEFAKSYFSDIEKSMREISADAADLAGFPPVEPAPRPESQISADSPKRPRCSQALTKALDTIMTDLHPKFQFVLRVANTHSYLLRTDTSVMTLPLSQWPSVVACWRNFLVPHFELVEKETMTKETRLSEEVNAVFGEYAKDYVDDEAAYVQSIFFDALKGNNYRPWPPVHARFTTAPLPPNTPETFYVTVYVGTGSIAKTFLCTGTTTAVELIAEAIHKTQYSHSLTTSTALLKTIGQQQFIFDNMPLTCYRYVRDMLKRGKRICFMLCSSADLNRESGSKILHCCKVLPEFSVPTVSSLDVDKPVQVQVMSALAITPILPVSTEQLPGSYFIAAALYYGGKLISNVVVSPPCDLAKNTLNWNAWLSFDLLVSSAPKESRLCFSVFYQEMVQPTTKQRQDTIIGGGPGMRPDKAAFANYRHTATETLALGKKYSCCWTSCRLFDYLTRLRFGTLVLPLRKGQLNPVGIPVDNMNLMNGSDNGPHLRVSFPEGPLIVFPQEEIPPPPAVVEVPPTPTSEEVSKLDTILKSDLLYPLTQEDKTLLWKYRSYCLTVSNGIVKVMYAVPWTERECVVEAHRLLAKSPLLDPVVAIELLDSKIADSKVRAFAVQCMGQLSWEEIADFLMQLVQALKCEPNHFSPLAEFLLARALENRVQIGHLFFWNLQSEIQEPEVRSRFGLLMQGYLRGCGEHRSILVKQLALVDKLMDISSNPKVKQSKTLFEEELMSISLTPGLPLPHDPCLCIRGVFPEDCRVLDSLRSPLWLVFENADIFGDNISAIFKADDDLRQDMLSLQVISLMNKVWQQENLELNLTIYTCIALGAGKGLIEVVLDSQTIANIQKVYGGGTLTAAFKERPLANWLREHNPSDAAYSSAVENFIHSCAGYCVATYVLGVGDRHNDNIMLTKTGHLFHIDFGHILGNAEKWNGIKRDRAPFVLTPEYVYVMGGGNAKNPNWQRFIRLCCDAYIILRKHHRMFISLFAMMLSTGMPELRTEDDINYLRTAFCLDKSEAEARLAFEKLIYKSLDTLMTRINNAIHMAAHPKVNDAGGALTRHATSANLKRT
eukprot:TRINITY_DN462_c4_g1_i2.p1 TRINITY_DN462_c4_g1~~TRINITY_DN462_c4_g1_i2.p1  ORF type:complete len:1707 (+),score=401.01 TRINITY_DN462_c4_g1_i2:109-5229(+)